MRISTAGTLAALVATVSAFADTAPFIVFGSEEYVDIYTNLASHIWLCGRI